MNDEQARIDALLASAGLERMQGRPLHLLPGTGNRTWRIEADGRDVVVRLPRGDTTALVDRRHERHNAAVAARLRLAPDLLHVAPDGAMVMAFVDGPSLAALSRVATARLLPRLGSALRRLHQGPAFLGVMDPAAKIGLSLGEARLDGDDRQAFGRLWPAIVGLRASTALDPAWLAPCHVDPQPANVLAAGDGVVLLDWEYSAMSAPHWDLAYASVEGRLDAAGEDALLAGYGALDAAALAPWKQMARAVSAAWCMARAAIDGDEAPAWREEVAARLAELAAALDDPRAAPQPPEGKT